MTESTTRTIDRLCRLKPEIADVVPSQFTFVNSAGFTDVGVVGWSDRRLNVGQ